MSSYRGYQRPRACAHRRVVLIGSEETGLRSARCAACQQPLSRRTVDGRYVYGYSEEVDRLAVLAAARRSCHKG